MATVHRRRGHSMLPPISVTAPQSVSLGRGGAATAGRGLLRRPRAPAPPVLPPDPPEPLESPALAKSVISEISAGINSYGGLSRYSPDPSIHPSVVSPPPPSELQSHHNYSHHHHHHQNQSHPHHIQRSAYIMKRDNHNYILDPLHRDQTNIGTYVEGRSLVRPYRHRGPQEMPAKPPKRVPAIGFVMPLGFEEGTERYCQPPAFTLQDFLIKVSQVQSIPLENVKEVMFSRHNYKKIQKMLAEELPPTRTGVTVTQMKPPSALPHTTARVPQRQLLLEMAAMVKEQMADTMNTEMKSVIRPLPKYSPSYKLGDPAPHTEILLYEAPSYKNEYLSRDTEIPGKDGLFPLSGSHFFHGSKRSNSPFAVSDENVISPAELAVLDALMGGGSALSLKANFISQLPSLESLANSITYLNLSFNDFSMVPLAVCDMHQLTVLKMRNNPLEDIPVEISKLTNLRVLVVSFCLISQLPLSLFTLENMEHFDIAYNKIESLQNEIKGMRMLRELNLEGNQLIAMPMGALKLKNLTRLKVSNNFMHPMFWQENSRVAPQSLLDTAALCFMGAGLQQCHQIIPEYIGHILKEFATCECCGGPLYGPGLRVIRPVSKIFGVRNVPFLFHCCSPSCKARFMGNRETLSGMLYGSAEEEGEEEEDHEEEHEEGQGTL